jgi:hypothetical protein
MDTSKAIALLIIVLLVGGTMMYYGITSLINNLESVPEPKYTPIPKSMDEVRAGQPNPRPQFSGVWSLVDIDNTKPTQQFRASHYDPRAGGPNCAAYYAGDCHSTMASGEDWRQWYGAAVAMPKEVPFWSVLVITEPAELRGRYVVLDRGGAIVNKDGIMWVDFLWDLETWKQPHGSLIEGYILPPGSEDN